MNALNGVQLDTYILYIKNQQEFQTLIKILQKDLKFPVKTRDIHKTGKKNFIGISVFGYENKENYPIYVSKRFCEEKNVDFLLIREETKRRYVLFKYFNTFMYDHASHRGRKQFCR